MSFFKSAQKQREQIKNRCKDIINQDRVPDWGAFIKKRMQEPGVKEYLDDFEEKESRMQDIENMKYRWKPFNN